MMPAALVLAAGLAATTAQAATGTFAEVSADVLSGNLWQRPETVYEWNSTAPVTLQGDMLFGTTNSQGLPGVTSFQYNGWAKAGDGALRVSSQITVDNPVARRSNPAWADDAGNPIPGGMPDGYALQSYASYFDSARVATPGATWVQFQLHIDGSFSAANDGGDAAFLQYASIQLDQRDGNQGWRWANAAFVSRTLDFDHSNFSFAFRPQQVDMTVWSKPLLVVNGQVSFEFSLFSRAELDFYQDTFLDGNGQYLVTSDFGHTVRVTGVRGVAANGSLMSVGALVGDSGTTYAAVPVPEPAHWVLLIAGLAGLGMLKRRRDRSD